MTETNFEQPFPLGAPNEAFAQYFIGQSYLAPLTDGGSVPVSNVTFEPGKKPLLDRHRRSHHQPNPQLPTQIR